MEKIESDVHLGSCILRNCTMKKINDNLFKIIECNGYGKYIISFRDKDGSKHRDDGKATEYVYDENDNIISIKFTQHDRYHREGYKPAVIDFCGDGEKIYHYIENGIYNGGYEKPSIIYFNRNSDIRRERYFDCKGEITDKVLKLKKILKNRKDIIKSFKEDGK